MGALHLSSLIHPAVSDAATIACCSRFRSLGLIRDGPHAINQAAMVVTHHFVSQDTKCMACSIHVPWRYRSSGHACLDLVETARRKGACHSCVVPVLSGRCSTLAGPARTLRTHSLRHLFARDTKLAAHHNEESLDAELAVAYLSCLCRSLSLRSTAD